MWGGGKAGCGLNRRWKLPTQHSNLSGTQNIASESHVVTSDLTLQIFPRVICVHYLETLDLMLVGTLDFNLAAIDCATKYGWLCTSTLLA